LSEDGIVSENYSDEAFVKAETEKLPETEAANPFDEFDIASFFNQYLDTGGGAEVSREREVIERPSFEKFLSSPRGLSDHLQWQLSVTICTDIVREIADTIIGNLDENGYLTASLEEIAENGKYTPDDVEEGLVVVQEFDPLGVGARDLRESLLIQLRTLDPQNVLAQQIVSDHLKQVQSNQLKEIARALNRPVELVKRAVEVIKKLDPRPGLRYNKTETRLVEPDVYFRKVDDQWQVFLNEDDLPQLRLSPVYRRLLARDAADREVRNYVKERFSAAIQLIKNIEQRKHTILRVCQTIIQRQHEYLDFGADSLKPMMIKEVAEEVGAHASGRAGAAIILFRVREWAGRRQYGSAFAETPGEENDRRRGFQQTANG
jgi:RNA polymerase sigma-54 factor